MKAEKLYTELVDIFKDTPLRKSDKQRKENMYRAARDTCAKYLKEVEMSQDIEDKTKCYLISRCITKSEFTANLNSYQYAEYTMRAIKAVFGIF